MKTRHPADALDAMLESLAIQEERQPDEFTIYDIVDRARSNGITLSSRTLYSQLERGVKDGTHVRRKINIAGTVTNVYRVK